MYDVLVVGCGNIAGGFDINQKHNQQPCTHAGAYRYDGRFNIVACIDPNIEVRKKFMHHFDVEKGFSSFEDFLISKINVDVVSICSPTDAHEIDINLAIKHKPKLIFCEKPVTDNYSTTSKLVDLCNRSGILFAVNYNRRWDPEIEKLKNAIQFESNGKLRSVVGYYNKGILNNGSHMLDLLLYLIGELDILVAVPSSIDYSDSDPTISALLCSKIQKHIAIHLVAGNANDYSFFELQLVFEKKVITMRDGGLYYHTRKPKDSSRFTGYKVLDEGVIELGGYHYASQNAVKNIYNALTTNEPLRSTGSSASKVQNICEKIICSSKKT